MAQRKKWSDEIVAVLKEFGGEATLNDVYSRIVERDEMILTKSWKNTVRRIIYDHSKDSEGFRSNELFYSVEGIGGGQWGLIDFVPTPDSVDLSEDDTGFIEGKLVARLHLAKERNPSVIRKAKQKFIDDNGKLFCEVCGFDFESKYGVLGEGFIEGHHLVPLSKLTNERTTRIEDIAMLCSNCHKMIHRRRPWLNRVELKRILLNS